MSSMHGDFFDSDSQSSMFFYYLIFPRILASKTLKNGAAVHTAGKILDERPSPSGVEYKCELEPLWLAAVLMEKAKMGHVHIRSYKNDLIRANRLGTLRKERTSFHKYKRVKRA